MSHDVFSTYKKIDTALAIYMRKLFLSKHSYIYNSLTSEYIDSLGALCATIIPCVSNDVYTHYCVKSFSSWLLLLLLNSLWTLTTCCSSEKFPRWHFPSFFPSVTFLWVERAVRLFISTILAFSKWVRMLQILGEKSLPFSLYNWTSKSRIFYYWPMKSDKDLQDVIIVTRRKLADLEKESWVLGKKKAKIRLPTMQMRQLW